MSTPNSSSPKLPDVGKRIDDLRSFVYSAKKSIEAKHASFIALAIVFLGAIINKFSFEGSCWEKSSLVLTIISLIITIAVSLWSFYPKRSSQKPDRKRITSHYLFRCENLEFYSEDFLKEALSKDFTNYKFDSFESQKIRNIIYISRAAARKYRLFRDALLLASLSILFFTLLLFSHIKF